MQAGAGQGDPSSWHSVGPCGPSSVAVLRECEDASEKGQVGGPTSSPLSPEGQ